MKNTSELANYQIWQTPGIKASGWNLKYWAPLTLPNRVLSVTFTWWILQKISWNWSNSFEEFPWFFVGLMEEMPLDEEGLARTPDGRVTCLKCFQTFSNMSNGERHYRSRHMNLEKVQCKFCQRTFKNIYSHNEHLRQSHGLSQTMLKSRIVPKNPEFT